MAEMRAISKRAKVRNKVRPLCGIRLWRGGRQVVRVAQRWEAGEG